MTQEEKYITNPLALRQFANQLKVPFLNPSSLVTKILEIPHPKRYLPPFPVLECPRPLNIPLVQFLFYSSNPRVNFSEIDHGYELDGVPIFKSFSAFFEMTIQPFKPIATAITPANKKKRSKTQSYYLAKCEFDTSLGTVSHKYLELMARQTINPTQIESAHPTVRETVTKMKNHLDTLLQKGWEIVGVEVVVPDFKNHCCGPIDIILRSTSIKTHFLLVDYKTRKKKDLRKNMAKIPL